MESEWWFKASFLAAFVWALLAVRRTAKRAVARHGGSLNQLEYEVRGLVAVRATLGVVFYGALLTWLLRAHAPTWMLVMAPAWTRWCGIAVMALGLSLLTWALRSLDSNYRGGVGLYDRHELVTGGAYGRVRHPIYAAFVVMMVGVLLVSGNWLLGVSGLLLVGSIAAIRVPVEERELSERFGSSWQRYCMRTGRTLPRLGGRPRGTDARA